MVDPDTASLQDAGAIYNEKGCSTQSIPMICSNKEALQRSGDEPGHRRNYCQSHAILVSCARRQSCFHVVALDPSLMLPSTITCAQDTLEVKSTARPTMPGQISGQVRPPGRTTSSFGMRMKPKGIVVDRSSARGRYSSALPSNKRLACVADPHDVTRCIRKATYRRLKSS